MPAYGYLILAIGWLLWLLPFPLTGWSVKPPVQTDRRARWGLLLQLVAYTMLWQSAFWNSTPGPVRTVLCVLFLSAAGWLSWTATRALGAQLRFDAALGADHELVRRGAYRLVRHPIYTSMLCMLLGTGFLITPAPLFLAAILVCLAGTEIRVRVEDRLLASRFGNEFLEYRRAVRAYVPFLR